MPCDKPEWPGATSSPSPGFPAPSAGRLSVRRTGRHFGSLQSSAQFVADFMPPDYLVDGLLQEGFLY